jgi:hypothetical protein
MQIRSLSKLATVMASAIAERLKQLHQLRLGMESKHPVGQGRRTVANKPRTTRTAPIVVPEPSSASSAESCPPDVFTPHATYGCAIGGVGFSAALAYEVAVQLGLYGSTEVQVLALAEDEAVRYAWDLIQQPWFQCHNLVSPKIRSRNPGFSATTW